MTEDGISKKEAYYGNEGGVLRLQMFGTFEKHVLKR